jgi:hypothetical protein
VAEADIVIDIDVLIIWPSVAKGVVNLLYQRLIFPGESVDAAH